MKQVGAAVLLPPGAHEDLLWAGNQALWSWAQRHCGKTPLFPASGAQDLSPPPAQAEIGCSNYLKNKPLSPQILISYCPK